MMSSGVESICNRPAAALHSPDDDGELKLTRCDADWRNSSWSSAPEEEEKCTPLLAQKGAINVSSPVLLLLCWSLQRSPIAQFAASFNERRRSPSDPLRGGREREGGVALPHVIVGRPWSPDLLLIFSWPYTGPLIKRSPSHSHSLLIPDQWPCEGSIDRWIALDGDRDERTLAVLFAATSTLF